MSTNIRRSLIEEFVTHVMSCGIATQFSIETHVNIIVKEIRDIYVRAPLGHTALKSA